MTPEQFEFDLPGSRAARDVGMQKVSANNRVWESAAIALVFQNTPIGWRGLPEALRPMIERTIGPPKHHNEYGALWQRMTKSRRRGGLGMFRETGNHFGMAKRSSHARDTREYERIYS